MKNLLIASKNKHKVQEIAKILSEIGYQLQLPPDDLPDVEENADTYEGNAALKACAYSKFTGLPCIADDTGLEVDYLDGAPGIYSARWAQVTGPNKDRANNEKMLQQLSGIPPQKRSARFVCVIVLAQGDNVLISAKGVCEGTITTSPRGTDGFGYDSLFEVPEYRKTFAELGPDIKDQISHRALALQQFKEKLTAL